MSERRFTVWIVPSLGVIAIVSLGTTLAVSNWRRLRSIVQLEPM